MANFKAFTRKSFNNFKASDNDDVLFENTPFDFNDVYEHSENFEEITQLDNWDEPDHQGDAIPWGEHPYILYYEQINKGDVGKCFIESETPPVPDDFSFVFGNIETQENEIVYLDKAFFKGAQLKFEEIDWDLKEVSKNKYLWLGDTLNK